MSNLANTVYAPRVRSHILCSWDQNKIPDLTELRMPPSAGRRTDEANRGVKGTACGHTLEGRTGDLCWLPWPPAAASLGGARTSGDRGHLYEDAGRRRVGTGVQPLPAASSSQCPTQRGSQVQGDYQRGRSGARGGAGRDGALWSERRPASSFRIDTSLTPKSEAGDICF